MIDERGKKRKFIYGIVIGFAIGLITVGSWSFVYYGYIKKDTTTDTKKEVQKKEVTPTKKITTKQEEKKEETKKEEIKEEKQEKVEEKKNTKKVVVPKLNQKSIDLTKCLNDDKSKFTLATEQLFTHAMLEIDASKKSVTLTSNIIKKCNTINTHEALKDYDTNNIKENIIGDFKKNIKQAVFGVFGKNDTNPKLLFLMEDGTMKYINSKLTSESVEENKLKCTYYNFELEDEIRDVEDLENITDLLIAEATEKKDDKEETYKTILASNKSGYFYNLYYLIGK